MSVGDLVGNCDTTMILSSIGFPDSVVIVEVTAHYKVIVKEAIESFKLQLPLGQ